MRVIISGLSFSDVVHQELTLVWKKDNSLLCDFTDLFEKDDKIILKMNSWKVSVLRSLQNFSTLKMLFSNLFSIGFCFFDKDVDKLVWSTGSNNIDLSKLPQNVTNYYFLTCHEFHFDRTYLKHLRPIKTIQVKIDENRSLFSDKTIGVHIRRSDHDVSIKESPLESFIEIMKYDLEKDSSINYFLATDDQEVEQILKGLFPGKILTYPKECSRTSVTGMQDAMVDLYSLSATSKIYGSFYSSFSDIAARIGNIPLKIIRKS